MNNYRYLKDSSFLQTLLIHRLPEQYVKIVQGPLGKFPKRKTFKRNSIGFAKES